MNKTYAFTDLHGMYELWDQIRDYCNENDTLFFLGDAIDRGPRGLLIMKELLQDKRVTYLKGNHEDIFSIVAPEIMEGHFENSSWWIGNGGYKTIEDFISLPLFSQEWYIRKINEMPEHITYHNKNNQTIILSHAGCSPHFSEIDYKLKGIDQHWIWDREHIKDDWSTDKQYENYYVVHGHTPVQAMYGQQIMKSEIQQYCKGHKFNLDLASSDIGKIALFDLDELKVEKYFYTML